MVRAVWNGTVIAEAEETVRLEGNHYFPPESINREYLRASDTTTVCPWKGVAHYYHVVAGGQTNPDAAWHYPRPSRLARRIKDHVAFWHSVVIEDDRRERARQDRGSPLHTLRRLWP